MKPYTPNTPRLAIAIAAATVSIATMVTLIGLPMAFEAGVTPSADAQYTTKAFIANARRDVGVAGEMMAAATTVPPRSTVR
jgi:hypothetical protein